MSDTPAGWYNDPWRPGTWRWWDGTQWGPHASSYAEAGAGGGAQPSAVAQPYTVVQPYAVVDQAPDVAGERSLGRWAGFSLIVIGVAQLGTAFTVPSYVHWMVDVFHAADTNADTVKIPSPPAGLVLLQPLSMLSLVGIVLIAVWLHRSSTNAARAGFHLPRSPGWTAASMFIPIINFWWPYQGAKALLPAGSPDRHAVGWWWATYVTATYFATVVGLVAYWSVAVAIPLGLLQAALIVAMVLNGRRMIAAAADAHE